ncbi:MAG: zf-TFIIB domain-containing protein [Gammaproteobacteria bacterium]|nr:zf-TFIIB domain-containing protein [Gammaproteobacteria bacterium]
MSVCPTCENTPLKPYKLEPNLPAKVCVKCNGCFINLLSYRNWLDGVSSPKLASVTKAEVISDDTRSAMACPNCSRLMQKFLIKAGVKNRVDVCLKCDEAWLDEGEWQLLHQLGLNEKLTRITTEPWQIRVKQDAAKERVEEGIKAKLGDADFAKVNEFKVWLQQHPQKKLIDNLLKRD